ncbi:hypothetical protein RintRC_6069 [Richelia intracellularis]|nr:hypothetical protein RintRC_6069 [Richelia intracellularis]
MGGAGGVSGAPAVAGALTTRGCACTSGSGLVKGGTSIGTSGATVAAVFWFPARRLKPH